MTANELHGASRQTPGQLSDHRYAIFFLRITGVWSHPVLHSPLPDSPGPGVVFNVSFGDVEDRPPVDLEYLDPLSHQMVRAAFWDRTRPASI